MSAFRLLVAGLLLSVSTVASAEKKIITSPNDNRDYQVVDLSNQLQVLVVSDMEAKNSAATLAIPVGSMHNPDEQLGLAHYLEHMLFLGSERYPIINDYSKFMRLNGGYTNAYTAQERTVYGFEVNDKVFPEALDRLGDVMRAPLLDETYANKERSTVNAEHQTYKGQDARKFYTLDRYTLNPAHPISRFSTGDLSTLKDKPGSNLQQELVRFFEQNYSANTMKAVLYGPRTTQDLAKLAEQYFTQIPNRNAKVPTILAPVVTAKELAIEASLKPSADIKALKISFLVPSVKDYYPYKPGGFISRILGSDRDGSLSAYLQQAGLVESLTAGLDTLYAPNTSNVTIQFQLTEKGLKQQDDIIAATFAYIELIKQTGVNQTQYDALAKSLENRFTYLPKSAGFNYSMSLVASMLLFPVEDIIYSHYRLDGFKPKLINNLLAELTPERVRIFVMSPDVKGDQTLYRYGDSYKVEPISNQRQQAWLKQVPSLTAKMSLPSGNRWLPESEAILPAEHQQQAVQLVNSDNVSLWFKQSEYFKEPKGSLSVELNNELSHLSVQNRVTMAMLIGEILPKKLVGLRYEAEEASLSFSVTGNNGLTVSTSGFNDKQGALMLQLLQDIRQTPLQEQDLALAKVELKRQIENKKKGQSINLAFSEFRNLVRVPSWSDADLLAAVDKVTLADLTQLREQIFQQSSLRMLVTGNFSSTQAKELQQQVLAQIKLNEAPFYHINRIKPEAKRRVNWHTQSEMGDAALGYIFISTEKGLDNKAAADLLNKIAYSEFYDQIRTQEQLSYSPFTASFPVGDYAAFGLFTQSPEKGPGDLQQSFERFIRNFDSILKSYKEADFNEVKQAYIANLTKKPSNRGEEFAYIAQLWQEGKPDLNEKAQLVAALQQTTLADIQAFYQHTVISQDNEQYLIQVVGSNFADAALGKLANAQEIKSLSQWQKQAVAQ